MFVALLLGAAEFLSCLYFLFGLMTLSFSFNIFGKLLFCLIWLQILELNYLKRLLIKTNGFEYTIFDILLYHDPKKEKLALNKEVIWVLSKKKNDQHMDSAQII